MFKTTSKRLHRFTEGTDEGVNSSRDNLMISPKLFDLSWTEERVRFLFIVKRTSPLLSIWNPEKQNLQVLICRQVPRCINKTSNMIAPNQSNRDRSEYLNIFQSLSKEKFHNLQERLYLYFFLLFIYIYSSYYSITISN